MVQILWMYAASVILYGYLDNRSERPPLNTDTSPLFCVVQGILYKVADCFDHPVTVA